MEITVRERTYRVDLTLGACREYKRGSGKEISEVSGPADIAELLYACAVSTGRRTGKPVEMTMEEFCDELTMDALASFMRMLEEAGLTGGEADGSVSKKKNPR